MSGALTRTIHQRNNNSGRPRSATCETKNKQTSLTRHDEEKRRPGQASRGLRRQTGPGRGGRFHPGYTKKGEVVSVRWWAWRSPEGMTEHTVVRESKAHVDVDDDKVESLLAIAKPELLVMAVCDGSS